MVRRSRGSCLGAGVAGVAFLGLVAITAIALLSPELRVTQVWVAPQWALTIDRCWWICTSSRDRPYSLVCSPRISRQARFTVSSHSAASSFIGFAISRQ